MNRALIMNKLILNKKYQHGAATLVITVLLLMGITLISVYATKIGVLDQKISANEYRHKEAFANAEAGLDQAAAFLSANPSLHGGGAGWETCSAGDGFPCDTAGAVSVYGTIASGAVSTAVPNIATLTNSTSYLVKTAENTVTLGGGQSADATGRAVVQVAYAKSSLITAGEIPPLMIPTGIINGSFTIVPNPNGFGDGQPWSIWSKDSLTTNLGTWQTCHHGDFQDGGSSCQDVKVNDENTNDSWLGCSCTADLTNGSTPAADQVDLHLVPAADFPNSPFDYLFGAQNLTIIPDDVAIIKAEIKERARVSGLVLDDCSNIVADFAGLVQSRLVWVEGDCSMHTEQLGSRTKPIVLIVERDITINGGAEIWGIIFGWDGFSMTGGPVIHGSAISEGASDLTNGAYKQVYDQAVFDNLTDDSVNTLTTKAAYSWKDF